MLMKAASCAVDRLFFFLLSAAFMHLLSANLVISKRRPGTSTKFQGSFDTIRDFFEPIVFGNGIRDLYRLSIEMKPEDALHTFLASSDKQSI